MFGSKYKKMQEEFLVSKFFFFFWVCVIMIEFFGFVFFLVHVLDETRSEFKCILDSNFVLFCFVFFFFSFFIFFKLIN